MTKDVMKPQLWTERPVAETVQVYNDWAERYDADVTGRGYHTPARIAEALRSHLPDDDRPVLDFGCGPGLSGLALRAAGIAPLHGTDISEGMIDIARPKEIYDSIWLATPGELDVAQGTYRGIVATGVISLGAAPPETMDLLIQILGPGDIFVMSFNDPTLEHGGYDAQLQRHIEDGRVTLLSRIHGPHLDDVEMGSDVLVLAGA